MKKIISILILSFGFIVTKAQTPKILISYDQNGNRILRQYVPARPAPPEQSQDKNDSTSAVDANNDTPASNLAAITDNNLKVYPNPSNDNFNVVVSEGILNNNAELVLMDQLGREQKRTKIKSSTTTISTKGMVDGVYTIIIQYGTTKTMTKVVKLTD